MHILRILRRAGLMGGWAALAACAADPVPFAPVDEPPVQPPTVAASSGNVALLACEATVTSGKVTCGVPTGDSQGRPAVLLGGQNTYVRLAGDSVSYADGVWQFRARVTNLLSQRLGTADGSFAHADGIRLVLLDATGGVTEAPTRDGLATYTAPDQPYWQLTGNLDTAATSARKTIQFTVPDGVTSFTFRMLVAAAIPLENGVLRWTRAADVNMTVYGISCPTADFCVAVGPDGTIKSWNGTSWSNAATGQPYLRGVHCASASFCVAVGGSPSGRIVNWNGTSWTTTFANADNNTEIFGVSCLSTTSCLAVGRNGSIQRWDGSTWTPVNHGLTTNSLTAASCATANYCVVVGSDKVILRWDGSEWATQTTAAFGNLEGVSCLSPTFCVAVGQDELRRWNGTQWLNPAGETEVTTGFGNTWLGVQCTSTDRCMAVGNSGRIAGWDGSKWAEYPRQGSDTFFGIGCSAANTCMVAQSARAYRGTR